mgnify:CR=1 FL=1
MELHICHLYPELLNMYGDIGNINILKYRAEKRGIDVTVHSHSVGDVFEAEKYDIVMLGGGQDFEMSIVSKDISAEKKEAVKSYIESGGVLLAICGGYQILGEYYRTPTGEKIDFLGILPFYTEGGEKRLIGNIVIDVDGVKCVGFENHAGKTYIGDLMPLGKVLKGYGNNSEDGYEGVIYKNTFGTYLHGPFLSKNPEMADRLLKAALEKRYGGIVLESLKDTFELKAKEIMLNRLEVS